MPEPAGLLTRDEALARIRSEGTRRIRHRRIGAASGAAGLVLAALVAVVVVNPQGARKQVTVVGGPSASSSLPPIPTLAPGVMPSPGTSVGGATPSQLPSVTNQPAAVPTVVATSVPVSEFGIPTPAAGLWGLVRGPDDNLWFTEMTAGKIGRIASGTGQVTEFPLPSPKAQPGAITVGPDQALWFTESGNTMIGRITTAGLFSEFPVPASPQAIVTGPDKALWFTEPRGGKIGRLTTGGTVTEFATPTRTSNPMGVPGQGSNPYDITAGPDGALWFTESMADQIGRITTAGLVTEFPLPDRNRVHGSPDGITAGPDGAIWFTEGLAGTVGRLDPQTKAFKQFPAPTAAGPVGLAHIIAAGGALWFTDVGQIGRLTTDGRMTMYAAPNSNTAGGEALAAGPGGTIWFTESRSNAIGRITP